MTTSLSQNFLLKNISKLQTRLRLDNSKRLIIGKSCTRKLVITGKNKKASLA